MAAFSADDLRRVASEAQGTTGHVPSPVEDEARRRASIADAAKDRTIGRAFSPVVLGGIVRALEIALFLVAGYLAFVLYMNADQPFEQAYAFIVCGVAGVAAVLFQSFQLYSIAAFRSPIRSGLRLACGWACLLLLATSLIFLFKLQDTYSRVWLLSWFGLALLLLAVERVGLNAFVRDLTRTGRLERRTVIVGGGPDAEELLHMLSEQPGSDVRICGLFDDRTDARSPGTVAGYPKLGNLDDLVEFARHTRVDLAIFTLPITAEHRLLQMLRKLWVLPIDIRLSAHRNKLKLRPRSYSYIGKVPVLDVFDKPIADWDVVMKLVFDKVISFFAFVLLSPVLAGVALAVKLDSRGPVLFKQKRHGFNNQIIEVFKFRSMYVDQTDPRAQKQVTRDDPRVTRVGRFIRRTSLDELPQLFNVLFKGDLSLVGPRPHAVGGKAADREYDEVVEGYFARHRVKPGITGWAQINGWRGETDTPDKMQNRIEHDLYYIENWSIFLDLYIIAITPFAVLRGTNAF